MDWLIESSRCFMALKAGDYEEAERSIRSSLLLYEAYPEKEDCIGAELYSLLGEVLLLKGALTESENAFEKSEGYFRRNKKEKVYRRGVNNFGLGEIALIKGDKEKAEQLFKRARIWLQMSHPADHLYRKRLAAHLESGPVRDLFPWQENEKKLLEKLKETTEKLTGSKELPLEQLSGVVKWEALIERALICLSEEKPSAWVQAYKYANEAFEFARTSFPLVHEASANSIFVMASSSEKMKLKQQAKDLYVFGLEVYDSIFGKDSLESALLRLNLANLFRKNEEYENADAYFLSAARVLLNNPEVNQEDFQKNAAQFVKMLDQKRAGENADLLFNDAVIALSAKNLEKALISVIGAEHSLSNHFVAKHEKRLRVLELKQHIFSSLDWSEAAEQLAQEVAAIRKEREQELKSWQELENELPVFSAKPTAERNLELKRDDARAA